MNLQNAITGYLIFKSTRASDTTITTDRVILNQFLTWIGDCDISTITSDHVWRYLTSLEERKLSPFTIRRHHATINGLYNFLSAPDIGLVSTNPAAAIPPIRLPKKKVKELPLETLKAMLAVTGRANMPRRARALLLFLIDSGARATEAAQVQLSDLDLKTGRVLLHGKPRGKERYVYLGKRTRSALWLYINEERPEPARSDDDDWLFLTRDGYAMDRNSIRLAIYRLAEWADVKANPHLFRHQAAIERLRGGMDVFSLQAFLGHEQLSTTSQYLTALNDEDVERQARRSNPSDNWRL